eukprot:Hpha_TRINITY_DN21046_c0_g1::TRINITY_DN21046_c0_g1_i1::g.103410::m.103410
MPASPVATLYRSILRSARVLDGSPLVPTLRKSPQLVGHTLSPKTRDLVETSLRRCGEQSESGEKGDGSLVEEVRREFRSGKWDLTTGFEVARVFGTLGSIGGELGKAKKLYSVGDVLVHRLWGHVGVVMHVYRSCGQPAEWVEANLGDPNHPFVQEPWYDILLDESAGGFMRHGSHHTHERLTHTPVTHSVLREVLGWEFDPQNGRYISPPQD